MPNSPASVFLIGAGPGDPGLITLRGRDRLAVADLVLYDYLVDRRVLQFAKPDAELTCLGRHGEGRILAQDDIDRLMIDAARLGRTVARLKGGDPAIFGRATEEIAALEAAGITYEVVPGVTAASAAACLTGIPLTHRGAASCVAFVTGQECRDKRGEALDLAELAQFPGTLVFYMGVTTAAEWATALVRHGKSGTTPVAIVRRASFPSQQTMFTTLAELPRVLAPAAIRPPAIVIVGQSVAERASVDWFAARPLFGRTVLVTRPAHLVDPLATRLADAGANVLAQPAIEIGPPPSWDQVDDAIARLDGFDWLVFSSANGVEYFLNRLLAVGRDARALGGVRLASIGLATSEALAAFHLRVDVQPNQYRAEALAGALAPGARGQRLLLVRASRGREVLADSLAAAGANVEQIVAYESRDARTPDPSVAEQLAAGRIDWVTVTSSAIARSLAKMFGKELAKTRLAAISPLTADAVAETGATVAAIASEYTADGLLAAILFAEKNR